MTDLALSAHPAVSGKHNMASDAFDALRTARLEGKTPKGEELTFNDLLDTLNPLQHIPAVSEAYRAITGDKISPLARVAGGALYGGPIGLVLSVADAAIEGVSGKDVGEHVVAGLFGGDKPATTSIAEASKPASPVPDTTGSVARAPAQLAALTPTAAQVQTPAAAPPKGMPQLSPDAFNALIGSFSDPKAAKTANPELAKKVAEAQTTAQTARAAVAQPPATGAAPDLLGAMQTNLDQLDALKAANPNLPVAAFAGGDTGGF